jgi:hypothetical protein
MPKSRHRKNHKKKVQAFKTNQKSRRNSDLSKLQNQMRDLQEKAIAKENNGEVPLDSISI